MRATHGMCDSFAAEGQTCSGYDALAAPRALQSERDDRVEFLLRRLDAALSRNRDLLKANRTASGRLRRVVGVLQRARAALVYHVAQTRPIQATQDVVDAIDACLSEQGGA